jgi:hypothetical protein
MVSWDNGFGVREERLRTRSLGIGRPGARIYFRRHNAKFLFVNPETSLQDSTEDASARVLACPEMTICFLKLLTSALSG